MEIKIKLPKELKVASRGQIVTFGMESVTGEKRAEFFAHAALHGLKQAISDAAANAKKLAEEPNEDRSVEEIAVSLMESKCVAFASGEWSQRRETVPLDAIGKRAKSVALVWIKANAGLKEKYKAAEPEVRKEIQNRVFEKYETELRKEAERLIAAEKEMAEGIEI